MRRQLIEKQAPSDTKDANSEQQLAASATADFYAMPNKRNLNMSTPVRPEPSRTPTEPDDGALDADVSLFEDDYGKVQGVVELSTLRQKRLPHIKVRVICLIDVSGSMLLKGDKRNRRSKISILKNMAVDMIDALEEEQDYFGVVTFGEESRVICPLAKVSAANSAMVKETVASLDKSGVFSSVTNLSSALLLAVGMLNAAQAQESSLVYRNCIIIFSDGEVNAGKTDPQTLVHVTREKIREVATPAGVLGDLWVNVSCVTTGSQFSEALYLLSKMCGSDAYFFVDGSRNHPEADMLVPLMLRKTACAQMVSVTVSASHGARIVPRDCSQEYSVRRKQGRGLQKVGSCEGVSYFIHDMPVGAKKSFKITLEIGTSCQGSRGSYSDDNLRNNESLDGCPLLSVSVQYVDAGGVLREISKHVQRQNVLSVRSPERSRAVRVMANAAVCSLRQIFQNTCRNVAKILDDGSCHDDDPETWKALVSMEVQTGIGELKLAADEVLPYLDATDLRSEFQSIVKAINSNLSKLQSVVTRQICSSSASRGKSWQFIKAMSSAVSRQLPTISNVLVEQEIVCPLQEASSCESVRTHALNLYVFGAEDAEDEERSGDLRRRLHNAAGVVATSLAHVLKTL